MSHPIWKDKIIQVADLSSVRYRIMIQEGSSQSTIYEGNAVILPGEDLIEIKINDICADYINKNKPMFGNGEIQVDDYPIFYVQVKNGNTWVDKESFTMKNDWSWDDNAGEIVSDPITNRIDARQTLCRTIRGAYTIEANVKDKVGVTRVVTFTTTGFALPSSGMIIAPDFSVGGSYANLGSFTIEGYTYNVVDTCARYVIHYRNAFGGWDSLLLEGKCLQRDSSSRKTMGVKYKNTNQTNKGKSNYVNEISRGYILRTGWLSDEESKRMHHLLNTTDAYLQDLEEGTILPVILGDQTNDVKTYRNQNGVVTYEFSASIAKDYMRK